MKKLLVACLYVGSILLATCVGAATYRYVAKNGDVLETYAKPTGLTAAQSAKIKSIPVSENDKNHLTSDSVIVHRNKVKDRLKADEVIVLPPPVCPDGTVGVPPDCVVPPPPVCPDGTVGVPPDCIVPPPPPPIGTIQFQENFDNLTSLSPFATEVDGGGPPTLVGSPTGVGKVLSATNSGSARRSEVTIRNGGNLQYDHEYIITFKTYVKAWDLANPPSWFAFNQYHSVPHLLATGKPDWTCVAGRNPVTLVVTGGKYTVNVNAHPADVNPSGALDTYLTANAQPMIMNEWVNWKLRIIPSLAATGVIQVWMNDVLIGERYGRNEDLNDKCGQPLEQYVYFKAGIYKEKTNTGTQSILFDDVKIVKLN